MNEFLHGPVWTCEEETGIPTDALPLVHEDPIVASLNREIGELYDSCYEFDSHDLPCWFNEEKEKADKPRMLGLLGKLNARIAELNDGSFVVDDQDGMRSVGDCWGAREGLRRDVAWRTEARFRVAAPLP